MKILPLIIFWFYAVPKTTNFITTINHKTLIMTNAVNTQKNNSISNGLLIVSILTIALIVFITMLSIAYQHGDGAAYSTGYEFGRTVRGLFVHSIFKNGMGLGSLIAVLVSWERNKSILWAVLHAIFGWVYVIYFALTRNKHTTN